MTNPKHEGRLAYEAGNLITDNPYEFDTGDYELWCDGWCEAEEENKNDH